MESLIASFLRLKSPKAQWMFILANSSYIKLWLDNDETYVEFLDDDTEERATMQSNWLGNAPGVSDLLSVLGIANESV